MEINSFVHFCLFLYLFRKKWQKGKKSIVEVTSLNALIDAYPQYYYVIVPLWYFGKSRKSRRSEKGIPSSLTLGFVIPWVIATNADRDTFPCFPFISVVSTIPLKAIYIYKMTYVDFQLTKIHVVDTAKQIISQNC